MATSKSAAGRTTKKQTSNLNFIELNTNGKLVGVWDKQPTSPYNKKRAVTQITEADLKRLTDAIGLKPVVKTRRMRVVERVRVTQQEQWMEDAFAALPKQWQPILRVILNDSQLSEGVREMMGRAGEMKHPVTALLAGVWMHPPSRQLWEQHLDDTWLAERPKTRPYQEVVVGSGIHAAIYCAVRVKQGFPRPLVLEQGSRAGGSFAMTRNPSFFLNSRNRAGDLSVPGDLEGALNVLPGAMLQPSDLSSAEYVSNDVLAFAIRACLAMFAEVVTEFRVDNLRRNYRGNRWEVLSNDYSYKASTERVILSSGLGEEQRFFQSLRLLTFSEFMQRMDTPFPLQGLEKVAVVGSGDSGKTAIEALCGQGPQAGWSTASLDSPRSIDWYGPGQTATCASWQQANRSRFKLIGKLLPDGQRGYQVEPFGLAGRVSSGYDCLYVGSQPYTHLIDCRGFVEKPISTFVPVDEGEFDLSGGRCFARVNNSRSVFSIGVGSQIAPDPTEQAFVKTIGENATSIFRYASRAAALAAKLPAP